MTRFTHTLIFILAAAVSLALAAAPPAARAFSFTDNAGVKHDLPSPPHRVVCLSPSVSQAIIALGAGASLKGLTWHDHQPPPVKATVVGGFARPSLSLIKSLAPQAVFSSPIHRSLLKPLKDSGVPVIELQAGSLKEIQEQTLLLGNVFGRPQKARELVRRFGERLAVVSAKLARLENPGRPRTMRFMGANQVMTPGDDSFQNEFIRAAGGEPPRLGVKGAVVGLSLEQWQAFNPQVVYACYMDKPHLERLLNRPGWNQAEAVRNKRIHYYACDLTCRPSIGAAEMVTQLAAGLHPEIFGPAMPRVRPDGVTGSKAVALDAPGVKEAKVVYDSLYDLDHNTLLLKFTRPTSVLSTLAGMKKNIIRVGNHYTPNAAWCSLGMTGPEKLEKLFWQNLGLKPGQGAMMITGADMENLAVGQAREKGLAAWALVTAGARGNAIRMGLDNGQYVEPGTINMIILTNRKLTPRAMSRAIITATEAKTTVMQGLDVRSTYTPRENQATGTGTDNIIVVQGWGSPAGLTGGHSKLGELIARAVRQAVPRALDLQEGMGSMRHVLARLAERRIRLYEQASEAAQARGLTAGRVAAAMEGLLLQPGPRGFMETALAMEDAWSHGQISDLAAWQTACAKMAGAGSQMPPHESPGHGGRPGPLAMALKALAARAAEQAHAK